MNLNNIYIIGFMASGKSSFGKKLAQHLDMNFVDLDYIIEAQERMSINEIFEVKGADYFRMLESESLRNLQVSNTVIALGGGTPCFKNNIDFIINNGLLIYLELPLKIIIGRLKQDKENRPLVKNLEADELITTVSELYNKRTPFYKKAHLILDMKMSKNKLKKIVSDYLINLK